MEQYIQLGTVLLYLTEISRDLKVSIGIVPTLE